MFVWCYMFSRPSSFLIFPWLLFCRDGLRWTTVSLATPVVVLVFLVWASTRNLASLKSMTVKQKCSLIIHFNPAGIVVLKPVLPCWERKSLSFFELSFSFAHKKDSYSLYPNFLSLLPLPLSMYRLFDVFRRLSIPYDDKLPSLKSSHNVFVRWLPALRSIPSRRPCRLLASSHSPLCRNLTLNRETEIKGRGYK